MSQVDILSGLGCKSSAAIRLCHQGRVFLLDAGGPLNPEEQCDWVKNTGLIDAILITHDHPDHIGSVGSLPWDIPLYCTPEVALSLPPGREWRVLPNRGTMSIFDVKVTTGRAGHSYGGVWLHLDMGGGLFYTGDASFESMIFPFDTPPSADTLLLDASYGLYDRDQAQCQATILDLLGTPTVLPLPLSGRALELAIWLHQLEKNHSIDWTMDRQCQIALRHMLDGSPDAYHPDIHGTFTRLANQNWPERASIMLVADVGDCYSDWPGHQLLHTGYLTPERHQRVAAGLEDWQRWNVHLRASDLVRLRDILGAQKVVPLFTGLKQTAAWEEQLGPCLRTHNTLELHNETESQSFCLSAPW